MPLIESCGSYNLPKRPNPHQEFRTVKRSLEPDDQQPKRPSKKRCGPLSSYRSQEEVVEGQKKGYARPLDFLKDATTLDPQPRTVACSIDVEQQEERKEEFNENEPIFTVSQMNRIGKRMILEREEQVRAEFDKILGRKLAEQSEAFDRFIDRQIQRRLQELTVPSYLS